ncbi:MAG: hypothetical protein MHPSP_000767 [Paramarteilia canceri]
MSISKYEPLYILFNSDHKAVGYIVDRVMNYFIFKRDFVSMIHERLGLRANSDGMAELHTKLENLSKKQNEKQAKLQKLDELKAKAQNLHSLCQKKIGQSSHGSIDQLLEIAHKRQTARENTASLSAEINDLTQKGQQIVANSVPADQLNTRSKYLAGSRKILNVISNYKTSRAERDLQHIMERETLSAEQVKVFEELNLTEQTYRGLNSKVIRQQKELKQLSDLLNEKIQSCQLHDFNDLKSPEAKKQHISEQNYSLHEELGDIAQNLLASAATVRLETVKIANQCIDEAKNAKKSISKAANDFELMSTFFQNKRLTFLEEK